MKKLIFITLIALTYINLNSKSEYECQQECKPGYKCVQTNRAYIERNPGINLAPDFKCVEDELIIN